MTDERWRRLEGLVDVETLGGQRVVVAGLGSGGSTVALELARAGVGGFVLIDPDRLEQPNVIRHECDDRYLGWSKADAVADLIRHRNPRAEIDVLSADLFDLGARLEGLVDGASLVAGCTDAEPPKHLLNRLCITAGVPAVYAGVYERAAGGEVIRCLPGAHEACYACVGSVLKESRSRLSASEELDYGAVDRSGNLHGAPGLGLDVRLIAMLHAKVCLLTLLTRAGVDVHDVPANVVLFVNAPVEGLLERPFASALVEVARQDGCLACEGARHLRH